MAAETTPAPTLKCPYCGSELHPPVEEYEWGNEDGHSPLDKHVCKTNPSHKFYTPA